MGDIDKPNVIFNASANDAVVLGSGLVNAKHVEISNGVRTSDLSALFTFNANMLEIGSSRFYAQWKLRIVNDIRLSTGGQFNASYHDFYVQYDSDIAQNIIPVTETYCNYNSFGQDVTNKVDINIPNLSFNVVQLTEGVYYIQTNAGTLRFVKM